MPTTLTSTAQVYQLFIKAPPQRIWDAITKPEFSAKYFFGAHVETDRLGRLAIPAPIA